MQVESLSKALKAYTRDTTEVEKNYKDVLADYSIYPAQVVNNSLTHVDNYITINKGSADSICAEMGVVSGNGIVGIVYQTSAHYAIVLPVLNSKSSISCKIRRTDYFGSLKWSGGSSLYAWLRDIPRHSEFSLGDTVVTSGHSAVISGRYSCGMVDDIIYAQLKTEWGNNDKYSKEEIMIDPQIIALQFNECISRADINALSSLMTENHIFIDMGNNRIVGKSDNIVKVWKPFFRLYPGYRNIFESVTVNGSMVIMQGYSICSDQVLNNVHAIWVAEIKENKVNLWHIHPDTKENRNKFGI